MDRRTDDRDLVLVGREIVDSNLYMTLATADGDGRPWASPVWFAHADHTDLLWVSRPEARHSRNIAGRPEVGIVIFDSTVPVGGAKAVYVEALAEQLNGPERDRGIKVYSRRSEAHGAGRWRGADVMAPARHRLYRARASETFLLQAEDRRMPVQLGSARATATRPGRP